MKLIKYIFIFSLICVVSPLQAVDIGSDTAVTRFDTQQTLNNGDRIAGFAALEAGFRLSSSSVSGTFDSFFPVTGDIELQGGTLILNRDLILRNVTSLVSLGNITGQGYMLELAPSITCIPTVPNDAIITPTCFALSNLQMFLNCDVCLEDCCLKFSGDSVLAGRGNTINLEENCTIQVDEGATLLIKDITIKGVSDNRIECLDNVSTITFENTELILDGDYSFTIGHFDVIKELVVSGNGHTFNYQTDQVSTISSSSALILNRGLIFNYDPPVASKDLLRFANDTSKLILFGATLSVSSTGLNLTKGIMEIDAQSFLSSNGTVSSEAISFGDGLSSANNFSLHLLPAAVLEALGGYIRLRNI